MELNFQKGYEQFFKEDFEESARLFKCEALEKKLLIEGFGKCIEVKAKRGKIKIPLRLTLYDIIGKNEDIRIIDMSLISPDYEPGKTFGIYLRAN